MNVGDIVEYKGKDYLAIKVNEKSAYICENRNFLNLWENRVTGTKWKSLCDIEGALKVNPEQLKVKEVGVVKVKPKRKHKIVSAAAEKELKESFNRFEKREKGKKTKSPFYTFSTASDRIYTITADLETKHVLFRNMVNDNRYFYNVETEKFTLYKEENHKSDKDILWPMEAQ